MKRRAVGPSDTICVGQMDLNALLRLMTERGASDLHLKPMRPPLVRIHGRLEALETDPLSPDQVEPDPDCT